jgi:hypothetical protein
LEGILARILKHSVEAEKSTFQGELSFQRWECTAGLTLSATFCAASKDYLVETVKKTLKWDNNHLHMHFILKMSTD